MNMNDLEKMVSELKESFHPLVCAVMDEMLEHSLKHKDEIDKITVFVKGFELSIPLLQSIIESSLSVNDHVSLNYRGQSFEIHHKDEVLHQFSRLSHVLSTLHLE